MPKKTLAELGEEVASRAPAAINEYYAELDSIRDGSLQMGGLEDRLSPDEAERLRREQALEMARAAREKALEGYRDALTDYHERLSPWTAEAAGELFGVSDTNALATAASADEEGLKRMLEMAQASGNKDLGKAAFVAATQRGYGDIQAEYFNRVNSEARELYREYRQVPSEEDMERQLYRAQNVLPEPTETDVTPTRRADIVPGEATVSWAP